MLKISSITRKITGKPVSISAVNRKKQDNEVRTIADQQLKDSTPAMVSSPTIELHLQLFEPLDFTDTPEGQQSIESLPITKDTTASDVIGLMIEKHGERMCEQGSNSAGSRHPNKELFYLKKCIESDSGIYKAAMDRQESIMKCLLKQQEVSDNGRLSFQLCSKQKVNQPVTVETTPSKTDKIQQHDISDPYFFSPPHVTEVKDRNYRRRNSLPSYINSSSYRAAATPHITSDDDIKDSNGCIGSGSQSPTASRNNKLQSLSEIMNIVVQETATRNHSPPERRCSSNSSSPKIRHLISSPFVSPEKLYPKFIYTPITNREGSCIDQSLISPDPVGSTTPPPVYSLDTSRGDSSPGTSNTSSPCFPLEISNVTENMQDHKEQSLLEEDDSFVEDADSLGRANSEPQSMTGNNTGAIEQSVILPPTTKQNSYVQVDQNINNNNTNDGSQLVMTSSPVSKTTVSVELNEISELPAESDTPNSCELASPTRTNTTSYDISTGLVSPIRRQSLLQEATAHVLRRRPSSGNTRAALTLNTTSDSDLSQRTYLQLNTNPKRQLGRQQSTPGLISPARHDMLVRKASQRVRVASAKRRSLILSNDTIPQGNETSL